MTENHKSYSATYSFPPSYDEQIYIDYGRERDNCEILLKKHTDKYLLKFEDYPYKFVYKFYLNNKKYYITCRKHLETERCVFIIEKEDISFPGGIDYEELENSEEIKDWFIFEKADNITKDILEIYSYQYFIESHHSPYEFTYKFCLNNKNIYFITWDKNYKNKDYDLKIKIQFNEHITYKYINFKELENWFKKNK